MFGQDPPLRDQGAEVGGAPAQGGRAGRGGRARPEAAAPAGRRCRTLVNGTVMRVDLARPLPPRASRCSNSAGPSPSAPTAAGWAIEDIDGATIYEVAQWYPRLAVYDDVRGWNTRAVLGQGEFYLEYGSFDVSLTVPADMLVAATGTLQNPDEVLTAAQRRGWPGRAPATDSGHPRQGRDRRPRLAPADDVPDAHLALHRRQRARLRLGRGAALRVGRGRRERRQDRSP